MKKLLLTLSAVLGVSAAAFGQGSVIVQNNAAPDFAGVNTVSTNANDATVADYYTGTMTLEIFAVQNATLATLQADESGINADSGPGNLNAALALLAADGFALQTINGGSNAVLSVSGGTFGNGTDTIGTSSTLTASGSTVNTDYAIVGQATIAGVLREGVLALVPSATGAAAPGTPINMNNIWPGSNAAGQAFNLYLQPVPEPTTLALAGLGGLSMLFLRRRKS
jgi:hypothetical protein